LICSELKRHQKAAQKAKEKAEKETSKAVVSAAAVDEHAKVLKKTDGAMVDPSDPAVRNCSH
jgi:uncharacterized protein GlcG (DUF336 family)